MKYKVGDKVKIKKIDGFHSLVEEYFRKNSPERVLTIKKIDKEFSPSYLMEEVPYKWKDKMIECVVEKYKKPKPIESRWDILDL